MRVTEIWRYPVKSLGGETLTTAPVDDRGIEGDRGWGVYDPATGMVLTGRREPGLLFLSARLVAGRPEIRTDRGTVLPDDAALSDHLGRPVELRSADDGPGTFENPMDIDHDADWVQWQSAGTTFHDGRSTVSLATEREFGAWDRRRFRINVIVDGDAITTEGPMTVGQVGFRVRKPIERCVMVSRAQPGIGRDLSVLKTIIREHDNQLGVGAIVTTPGTISIGDELA